MSATSIQHDIEHLFVDTMMDRYRPSDDSHFNEGTRPDQTVDYYGRKGWEGYNETRSGRIVFVKWDDDIRIMVTNHNGVIESEARFDMTELGVFMFAAATDAVMAK